MNTSLQQLRCEQLQVLVYMLTPSRFMLSNFLWKKGVAEKYCQKHPPWQPVTLNHIEAVV